MTVELRELDGVELLVDVDDRDGYFAAGTTGAIVDLGPDYVLVEIVRKDGTTAGLLGLRHDQVRCVWRAPDPPPDDEAGDAR